jgi:ATP-dependent Lon protease
MSYVKSHLDGLGIAKDALENRDVHVHVPAGAIPKDGPSAGVAIFSALVSLLTRRCVRADVAMTGEITLRGLVLPVGGIKEKLLAAHRAGIRRILLPERNSKDVVDVPQEILDEIEIVFAKSVDDVLLGALEDELPEPPPSADASAEAPSSAEAPASADAAPVAEPTPT